MQATDIVLDGAGYMVVPGSYQRLSDGEPEGRAGRWVQRDFVGGQRRALQLERDRGWDAEGVGPALGGQGVEPWPFGTTHIDGGLVTPPATTLPARHAVLGAHVYIGIGRHLYRSVSSSATAWANLTQIADLGAGNAITGVCAFNGTLAVCCGATRDIQVWDPATSTLATFSAGARGTMAIGYAGCLLWADATTGNEHLLRMSTGGGIDSRALDATIANLGLHGGKIVIATRSSISLLGGKGDPVAGEWSSDPEPIFSHGVWTQAEDYRFLASYGGKLYTWLAGQVMEWNPNGGASKQGWRSTGIEGRDCFGGVVAGDRLIVSSRNRQGDGELWSYDGSGWWLIETGNPRLWPAYLAGAGTLDLLAFRSGSTTYDLYRLLPRDATTNAFRASGTYKTSLIDGGERDIVKAWRSVGVSFATPEQRGNPSSTDPVTISVAYSIDGGASFIAHQALTLSDPNQRLVELGGAITGGAPESKHLQIRVTWSSVSDWAPTLTGIWAGYELLGSPARRRKWRMSVTARDGIVQRDGAPHPRTGREIVADLWSAWEIASTLTLRDIDYDVTGIQHAVRIAGITEEQPKVADAGRWETAMLKLTLIEV